MGKEQKGPSTTENLITPATVHYNYLEIKLQMYTFQLAPFHNISPSLPPAGTLVPAVAQRNV